MAHPDADLLDYLEVMKCIRMMMLYMLLCYSCCYDLMLHSSDEVERGRRKREKRKGKESNALEQEIINIFECACEHSS
jgi:hypothetical protein